jgi:PAS domain S-box-containing protein
MGFNIASLFMSNIQLRLHGLPYPVKIIGAAAIYIIAAKLGLRFATIGQNVTLVWPPAGLALAALLLSNFRLWPGVALGAFVVHATTGFALPEVVVVTVGNTLEAAVGAYLLRRWIQFHPTFDRVRDVLGFVALAVLVSPCASASLGALSLLLNGLITPDHLSGAALTWWAGDAMGILIVAPPVLIIATQRENLLNRQKIVEAAAIVVAVVVISGLVFRYYPLTGASYPLAYLTFPFLIWAALRFGQHGTSIATVIISVIAVWGASSQISTGLGTDESVLFLFSFIVVESVTSMLLAAVLAEHERTAQELTAERDFANQIMSALGQGLTITNGERRFEFVNDAYARMLGYTTEDLVGKTPVEMTVPEDYAILEQAYRQRTAGQTSTYQARLKRADGGTVPVLITGTPRWQNGQVKGVIASITDLTEHVKIENALRENQARLQAVIENFPFQFWATDLETRYVLQSPVSIERWGNYVGKRLDEIEGLSSDTIERWKTNNRRVLAGEMIEGEAEQDFDGEHHNLYFIIAPIRDGDSIIGAMGVDIDITSLKRAERNLEKTQESTRAFLERLKALHQVSIELASAPTLEALACSVIELGRSKLKFDRLGLWFVDDEQRFMYGSFGTDESGNIRDEHSGRLPFNYLDYPLREISDGTARVFFNQHAHLMNDRHEVVGEGWNAMAYLQDGGRLIGTISTDNLLKREPPEPYALELLALYGQTIAHLAIRLRAEEAVQKSEARFRSIFETSSIGIAVVDKRGYPVSVNPAFVEMLGYSEAELCQMPFSAFTHPDDVGSNLVLFNQLIAGENKGYELDKRYVRKDGGIVWVRMRVSRYPGISPERDFAIALTEDITEQKRAEAALQQLTAELELRVIERTAELEQANQRLTELDRLKTKFISDVSHELRTPLAVLNTRVYLLQHAGPEKHGEYLTALKQQIERLTHFVNTILDLSRLELGADRITFGPVNLNDIAEQVVNTLSPRAEMAGLTMDFQMGDALPPVRGELNQLAQVATNLTANAINYTTNGSIHIRTGLDEQRDRVCLEVQDTGIGIHPDDQAHLFERFYRGERAGQSNIPGSGLGLSIVKEIVDMHSGSIEMESEVGKGTLFRVWLPVWHH